MKADIPLYLWESFIAVIEETTLQRAAKKLHTTQPTITRHLHQLEESLPLKLFELRGRAKKPTPFAHELYQKINLRLKYLPEDIRESLRTFDSSRPLPVSISGSAEILRKFVSPLSFKGPVNVSIRPPEDLRLLLKEGRTDLVFGEKLHESSHYVVKKIFQNNLMLIVPKKFTRGRGDLATWKKNASQFPLGIHDTQSELFRRYIHSPKIDMETQSWQLLEERVQRGLCWSAVPRVFIRKNPDYFAKPLVGSVSSDVFVYGRRELTRHAWFKDMLLEIAASAKV